MSLAKKNKNYQSLYQTDSLLSELRTVKSEKDAHKRPFSPRRLLYIFKRSRAIRKLSVLITLRTGFKVYHIEEVSPKCSSVVDVGIKRV